MSQKITLAELIKLFRHKYSYFTVGESLFIRPPTAKCFTHVKRSELMTHILGTVPKELRDEVNMSVVGEAAKHLLCDSEAQRDVKLLKRQSQFLLNLSNGVFDIESSKLVTGTDADKLIEKYGFTYELDFNYVCNAVISQAPAFKAFLETSLDYEEAPDKTQLLLEILGVCISSVQVARHAYFLVGATKSGKSQMTYLIERILRPSSAVQTFRFNKIAERFNLQHLEHSRINISRELPTDRIGNSDVFKQLAADESLYVEGKGKEGHVADIHVKLLSCGNNLPNFGEMDASGNQAIVDRLVVLKFPHTIPESKMDRKLVDKLFAERDVIFSLVVDALKQLHDRNYIFTEPSDSKVLMEQYVVDSRSLELFIEERCSFTGCIHTSVFIEAYREYCKDNAPSAYSVSEVKAFIANMHTELTYGRFRLNGKNLHGWKGISLKPVTFDD